MTSLSEKIRRQEIEKFDFSGEIQNLRRIQKSQSCTPQIRKIVILLIDIASDTKKYSTEALEQSKLRILMLKNKFNIKGKYDEPFKTTKLQRSTSKKAHLEDSGPKEISNCPNVRSKSMRFYIRNVKEKPVPNMMNKIIGFSSTHNTQYKTDNRTNQIPSNISLTDTMNSELVKKNIIEDLQREIFQPSRAVEQLQQTVVPTTIKHSHGNQMNLKQRIQNIDNIKSLKIVQKSDLNMIENGLQDSLSKKAKYHTSVSLETNNNLQHSDGKHIPEIGKSSHLNKINSAQKITRDPRLRKLQNIETKTQKSFVNEKDEALKDDTYTHQKSKSCSKNIEKQKNRTTEGIKEKHNDRDQSKILNDENKANIGENNINLEKSGSNHLIDIDNQSDKAMKDDTYTHQKSGSCNKNIEKQKNRTTQGIKEKHNDRDQSKILNDENKANIGENNINLEKSGSNHLTSIDNQVQNIELNEIAKQDINMSQQLKEKLCASNEVVSVISACQISKSPSTCESKNDSDQNADNGIQITLELATKQQSRHERKRKAPKRTYVQRRSKRLKQVEIKSEVIEEDPFTVTTSISTPNKTTKSTETCEPNCLAEIDSNIPIINEPVLEAQGSQEYCYENNKLDEIDILIKTESFEADFGLISEINIEQESSVELDLKPKIKVELIDLPDEEIETARETIENISFINHRISFQFSCLQCQFTSIERTIFLDHLSLHDVKWTGFCVACDTHVIGFDGSLHEEFNHMLKVHVKNKDIIVLDSDPLIEERPILKIRDLDGDHLSKKQEENIF